MGLHGTVNGSPNGVARARRYDIGTVLRYRVRGEREWREGVMENISITGVRIRTTHYLKPDTVIEMRFFLPIELNGECAAEVLCRGSVVRASECEVPGGEVVVAARIDHSRFLRQMSRKEELAKDLSTGSNRRLD